jgi:hypothetical protein
VQLRRCGMSRMIGVQYWNGVVFAHGTDSDLPGIQRIDLRIN